MENHHKISVVILIIALILSLYFYFFTALQFCFIAIFILALLLIVIILSAYKKYLVGVIPQSQDYMLRQKVIQLAQDHNFRVEEKEDHLYVKKNWITATRLFFVQNGTQVDLYRRNAATGALWALIILGALFFGIIAIFVGVISESNSKELAETTIYPLLKGEADRRRCGNCGRLIPSDAVLCPYCGKRL